MIKHIMFIGLGLIGSSMARAVRAQNNMIEISAIDTNAEYIEYGLEHNIIDAGYTSFGNHISNCDLIVICTPVGAIGRVTEEISAYLHPDTVLTDVGSVKQSVIDAVEKSMPYPDMFVPGHPIAGAETSGPMSGRHDLFEGRWSIITPVDDTSLQAIEKVTELWELCGSDVEFMDPKHHDLVLAVTSHIPHLIAYSIVGTATNMAEDLQREVIQYSAGGFRDFTRIAGSDPIMWRDIFLGNKESVLDVLQRFTEDLSELQKAIRQERGDFLENQFTKTREIRNAVIDSGQA